MDAAYIKTMGMSCSACGRLVEKSIGRLSGVIAVESDQQRGLTSVVFDPHVVDEFEISDRIQQLGFRTRIVNYPQAISGAPGLDDYDTAAGAAPARGPHLGLPKAASPGEERTDVHVVHIRTSGLRCDDCTALVERKLSHLEGVMDVMSVRALGLTSVLFDGSVVGPAAIVDEIRGAGFGANAVR